MKHLLNRHIGPLLLGVAVFLTALGISSNPQRTLEPVAETLLKRNVTVKLDKSSLAALSSEVFFTADEGTHYEGPKRFVWVREKSVIVFQPVDLEIPPANIMRAPQLLPEPGPSLEGTQTLPRFGDEFPPIVVVDPKAKAAAPTPVATPSAPAATAAPAVPAAKPVVPTKAPGTISRP